jgi:hypothetical protein
MAAPAAAIAISYFDRQTLSVAITAIQADFPITNAARRVRHARAG